MDSQIEPLEDDALSEKEKEEAARYMATMKTTDNVLSYLKSLETMESDLATAVVTEVQPRLYLGNRFSIIALCISLYKMYTLLWLCIKFLVQDFFLPGIFIHEECHKVQENHFGNHF